MYPFKNTDRVKINNPSWSPEKLSISTAISCIKWKEGIPQDILIRIRHLLKIQASSQRLIKFKWQESHVWVDDDIENHPYAVIISMNNCSTTTAYIAWKISDILRAYSRDQDAQIWDLLPKNDYLISKDPEQAWWEKVKRKEIESSSLDTLPFEILISKKNMDHKLEHIHTITVLQRSWNDYTCFHQFGLWWKIWFSSLREILNYYHWNEFLSWWEKPLYYKRKIKKDPSK